MNNIIGIFKRRRKLAWLCLFAVIAVIGIAIWSYAGGEPRASQKRVPGAFSVSFQGYSNSPSGQRWAILTVTNRDFRKLSFLNPLTVEFASSEDWQEPHWKTPRFIPPRSCGKIAVEIPPVPGAWRARCVISLYTWKDLLYNALSARGWPNWLIPVRSTAILDGLDTDWISESPVEAVAVPATNPPAPHTDAPAFVRNEPDDRMRISGVRMLRESLNLTDDQVKQLEPILEQQRKELSAFRRQTSPSRQERKARLKQMRETQEAQLQSVLTPEQFEQWRKGPLNLQASHQQQPELWITTHPTNAMSSPFR